MRGAPSMLTENTQSTKYLVNGARGFMHSLSFSGDAPTELTEAMAAPGFSLVMLDEPPLTINFQLTLPDGDDGAGIDSLVEDAVVVPALVTVRYRCMIAVFRRACDRCSYAATIRYRESYRDNETERSDRDRWGREAEE